MQAMGVPCRRESRGRCCTATPESEHRGHRKTNAVVVAGVGIGILTEDHDANPVEGTEVEDAEEILVDRTNLSSTVLFADECRQFCEIGFVELLLQHVAPTFFDSHLHFTPLLSAKLQFSRRNCNICTVMQNFRVQFDVFPFGQRKQTIALCCFV